MPPLALPGERGRQLVLPQAHPAPCWPLLGRLSLQWPGEASMLRSDWLLFSGLPVGQQRLSCHGPARRLSYLWYGCASGCPEPVDKKKESPSCVDLGLPWRVLTGEASPRAPVEDHSPRQVPSCFGPLMRHQHWGQGRCLPGFTLKSHQPPVRSACGPAQSPVGTHTGAPCAPTSLIPPPLPGSGGEGMLVARWEASPPRAVAVGLAQSPES